MISSILGNHKVFLMIIYIHGFGSSGKGHKVTVLKEWFGSEKILSPSLSYIPELAIDTLSQLIELLQRQKQVVQLIGSSLGGFYSLYLAEKYQLSTVLINPAVAPSPTLKQALGHAKNYYDDSYFLWTEQHIDMLKKLAVSKVSDEDKYLLLLQKFDEVLDYRHSLNKLPGALTYVDEDGDHGYGNIAKRKQEICDFLID